MGICQGWQGLHQGAVCARGCWRSRRTVSFCCHQCRPRQAQRKRGQNRRRPLQRCHEECRRQVSAWEKRGRARHQVPWHQHLRPRPSFREFRGPKQAGTARAARAESITLAVSSAPRVASFQPGLSSSIWRLASTKAVNGKDVGVNIHFYAESGVWPSGRPRATGQVSCCTPMRRRSAHVPGQWPHQVATE